MRTDKRYEIESEERWKKWIDKIPFIRFPRSWKIKIIPPFGGAMVRFQVKKDEEASVSVYLDVYESLGFFGSPYWGIYPYNGDVERVAMSKTDELLLRISESIVQQEK